MAKLILTSLLILAGGCNALPSPSLKISQPASLSSSPRWHKYEGNVMKSRSCQRLRGGGLNNFAVGWTPDKFFDPYLGALALGVAGVRIASRSSKKDGDKSSEKEAAQTSGFLSLQRRFLAVFWLWKLADWLHGPYFYELYASKLIGGVPMSQHVIGQMFLCGFASSMLFGTFAGSLVDGIGRKAGCMAFAIMYIASALSTRSNSLATLIAGRVLGGTATSLLFSAPEAWLVGEHQAKGYDGSWLGKCFELAYFGDGLIAILAGLLADGVAQRKGGKGAWLSGPSSPFELSIAFLAIGAAIVASAWGENYGGVQGGERKSLSQSMSEAVSIISRDRKILFTGAVQSLFEGAMYIFVLQWTPAFKSLIASGQSVLFGRIFSCFMTACMLGSSLFGLFMRSNFELEGFVAVMLAVAGGSLATSAWVLQAKPKYALHILSVAFFVFETCVGLYFPSIGTMRSKYVPNSHKSAIMNLFRIPLNLVVIATYLSINRLGTVGALVCASAVLFVSFLSQVALRSEVEAKAQESKDK